MGKIKQGDARPAYSLEKEAVREEIQTGLQTGVEILAGNVEKDKETDHFHNTKYLLKQYRRVEYSIRISEADLNLRMEMQHGMRLSTLEVNTELAGIDLTGTKLENHALTGTSVLLSTSCAGRSRPWRSSLPGSLHHLLQQNQASQPDANPDRA